MNKKRFYQLALGENREADIYIFGDITSWEYLESDVSSYTLSREIQGLDVDQINVYINSYGGEVAEGLAIYNQLKNHKARVRTICDGFACSAASVVFMAGNERLMNPASLLMIHNAWSSAAGNAAELRKAADDLETISAVAANTYKEHITISGEELDALLAEESWITPQDALEKGFATSIIGQPAATAPSQSARMLVFSALTKTAALPASPPGPTDPPEDKTLSTFLSALSTGGKE